MPRPGDASQLGCVIDFMQSVLTFDPHCKHLTLPWTQGPQIVLFGFVVKAPEAIPSLDADLLVRAGFNLPCQDTVTSLSQSVPASCKFLRFAAQTKSFCASIDSRCALAHSSVCRLRSPVCCA